MRLAENKKLAAKAKSIREANEIIRKANNNRPRGQPTNQVDGDGRSNGNGASDHSFENELETLAPDEVCKLLVDSWDDDNKLRELMQLISKHLQAMVRPPISNTVANSPTPLAAAAARPPAPTPPVRPQP